MGEPKEAGILRKTTLDYIIRFICYLLILLPAALGVLYVRAYGVSVVFADAWSMVPLFDKWSSGSLRVSDLFRPHVEHRMFFPKGIELLLGIITKYNNLAEMYVVLACFLVTLVILLLAFKRGIESSSWLFLFIPISLLVFSLRQHDNMLWGFQISFAFVQTFGVLALFLLYALGHARFKKSAFTAALGSATVASFSMVQGLLVWPVGLLQLFIGPLEKPKKRVLIILWGLVGLFVWVTYFIDYEFKDSPSLLYALTHPLLETGYFLNLLGSSLFWQPNLAFIGGLLLACLAVASLFLIHKAEKLGEQSFWVSLVLFSFLILAAITLGRSGRYGVEQALVSRYTTFSILAVVGLYAMLVKSTFEERSRLKAALLVVLVAIMLPSVPVSYSKGIEEGSKTKTSREKAALVLSTYESQPDEALHRLNPRPDFVRKRAPTLQRLGYNVFSEGQAPDLPPSLSDLSPVASPTPYAVTVIGPEARQENR